MSAQNWDVYREEGERWCAGPGYAQSDHLQQQQELAQHDTQSEPLAYQPTTAISCDAPVNLGLLHQVSPPLPVLGQPIPTQQIVPIPPHTEGNYVLHDRTAFRTKVSSVYIIPTMLLHQARDLLLAGYDHDRTKLWLIWTGMPGEVKEPLDQYCCETGYSWHNAVEAFRAALTTKYGVEEPVIEIVLERRTIRLIPRPPHP